MDFKNKIQFKYQEDKIKRDILNWYNSKEKYLNIISPPYNSSNIFLGIILKSMSEKEKVLYLTNEVNNSRIVRCIKDNTDFRGYTYIRENSDYYNSSLIICNFDLSYRVKDKFDLVICDDISGVSKYDREYMTNIARTYCKEGGRIISYSIENLFEGFRELVFPVRNNGSLINEPRVLFTRININKDIPYIVYEYLNWSITINKKIIIYVPDEERVRNVYTYLYKLSNKLKCSIDFYIDDIKDDKTLINFSKKKNSILITNYFGEQYLSFRDINVMVYFADDEDINYKKLIYLSGVSGNVENTQKGEVIFLAKKETEDIALAKNITRKFNKEAWDMGLLDI